MNVIDWHDYEVELTSSGPNTGVLTSGADDLPDLVVASPPEFGGPGAVWSPEHLLVAALASCLMTTFRAIAANSGVEVLGYTDRSTGRLLRGDDGVYRIAKVTLRPMVVISEESRADRTLRLLEKAERVCLISRSVSSDVELVAKVVTAHHVGT